MAEPPSIAFDPAARRLVEVEQRFLMMCTKHPHSAYCEDVAWLLTERRRLLMELDLARRAFADRPVMLIPS